MNLASVWLVRVNKLTNKHSSVHLFIPKITARATGFLTMDQIISNFKSKKAHGQRNYTTILKNSKKLKLQCQPEALKFEAFF